MTYDRAAIAELFHEEWTDAEPVLPAANFHNMNLTEDVITADEPVLASANFHNMQLVEC